MADLALQLSPRGHLLALPGADATALAEKHALELTQAFGRGAGHGLLQLGTAGVGQVLPPVWGWWRDFAASYVTALCALPDFSDPFTQALPAAERLQAWVADAPPMQGAEYLTGEVLATLWQGMDVALAVELAASGLPLQAFLKSRHPIWNMVGRVYFNLAENRKDPDYPFAFLATYTARLSTAGKAQHQPLSRALAEFSGAGQQSQLLSLLLPVQRAAAHCAWLDEMVKEGGI